MKQAANHPLLWLLAAVSSVLCIASNARAENEDPEEAIEARGYSASYAPWQAGLFWAHDHPYRGYFCGAVILSDRWLVTAAHCVVDPKTKKELDPQSFRVFSGSLDLEAAPIDTLVSEVAKVIKQSGYDTDPSNDIALLKLKNKLKWTATRKKIGLHTATASLADRRANALLTGWGKDEYGRSPNRLQEVEAVVIDNKSCQALWPVNTVVVSPNALCTYKQGSGTCHKDSGGPVTVDGKLVGVASRAGSYQDILCPKDRPDIHVRISSFAGWIRSHTGLKLQAKRSGKRGNPD